ncbi:MAG: PKD domain-containing protein, partial [Flavipsychrobacter sp.]|nr:PKD domain-containing protein [Flavipsychrobacter sp.]
MEVVFNLGTGCSTPAAIGGPSAVCVGSTITLTNDTTGGTWSSASTSIASVNTSGVVTGNAAGTTTISYSKGTGCTVTKTVTVNALPTNVIASFNPQPSIPGLPISFTVSNTSLSSYTWNFGDATSSSTMNPTKAYATSGTFIPTLTVTNSNGCSSSDTAVVVVSPVPPITGYTPPLCTADAPDTLRITVPGGTWSSSNTGAATVGMTTGILTAVAPGTAVITYHFGSGLFTTTTVTAGNSPNPIFGPSTTCMGSNTGLNVTPYGSAGVWTSSTTSVATIGTGNGICSAVSLGTTTITWTNPWGCYVTRTQTVVASPAAITGPSFLCSGDTSTYLNDTLGGTWSSTNSGVVSIDASTGL